MVNTISFRHVKYKFISDVLFYSYLCFHTLEHCLYITYLNKFLKSRELTKWYISEQIIIFQMPLEQQLKIYSDFNAKVMMRSATLYWCCSFWVTWPTKNNKEMKDQMKRMFLSLDFVLYLAIQGFPERMKRGLVLNLLEIRGQYEL